MSYLRIPSYMIMDEAGRGAYPIVSPTFNDRRFKFEWSEATLRELEAKILHKANSIGELAALMKVDEAVLQATIAGWNSACDARDDRVHQRPSDVDGEDCDATILFCRGLAGLLEHPWRPRA